MSDVLYQEKYRPQFHFTAKAGWLNDPNGLVYYDGEYHLFFQHNPFGTDWGNMTWGHAISRDLVHWEQLPNVLEPDRLGTMFSGSAVVDWGNTSGFGEGRQPPLVAIYTAAGGTSEESKGQPFTQCLAYSRDKGRTFIKYPDNPVLGRIAEGNRDPKVIWHEPSHRWIMALYLQGNDFALFSSPNLKEWDHLHNVDIPGGDECPDFFPLKAEREPEVVKWVLMAANGTYLVGKFDGQRFTPETKPQPSDEGENFYAIQSYSDVPKSDGRRIQIAWMRNGRYPGMPFNQQMSFPCELKLHRVGKEGWRLSRWPVKEIQGIHEPPIWWSGTLQPGKNPLEDAKGESFDLQLEMDASTPGELHLTVRGEEVRYSAKEGILTCLGKTVRLAPLEGKVKLRLLIDRTSIEAFGNDGAVSISSCFLPEEGTQPLSLAAVGGEATIRNLNVYPLRSAWQ
jgi:levanase/fructan beta-fructosidase